jgi:5-enolpyruvylshikimate-3-phosphate synthase
MHNHLKFSYAKEIANYVAPLQKLRNGQYKVAADVSSAAVLSFICCSSCHLDLFHLEILLENKKILDTS